MKRVSLLAVWVLLSSLAGVPGAYPADVIMPSAIPEDRMGLQIMWEAVRKLPVPERPKIVLVLGGGGARGLSHIGVLRVLEEERVPVDEIIGVSVGALIGALYASGVSVGEIERMAGDVGWATLTDFSRIRLVNLILSEELLSTEKMEKYLKNRIGDKFFSELKIPFSCVATDLRTGEKVVFKEGPVAIAARASSTIPGLFRPVEYRQRYLVDGGVTDNLPVNLVDANEDNFIVAVRPNYTAEREELPNVLMTLLRSIEIQGGVIIKSHQRNLDFSINPNVGDIGFAQLDRFRECIESGIVAGRVAVPQLKRQIINRMLKRMHSLPASNQLLGAQ